MDKKLKSFLSFSAVLIAFFFLIFFGFVYIYRNSTINFYNRILLIFMLLTIIILSFSIVAVTVVFCAYRNGKVAKSLLPVAKLEMNTFIPLVLKVSNLLKTDKDKIRSFYIDLNNILVQSDKRKFSPEEVLILIPHCLQYSECEYKITNDINNCRRCGRCRVGEISSIAKKFGVPVEAVTGGTAARNLVNRLKPKFIFSVACERDLLSGIIDVSGIPVIGVVNKRPNGPCYNTDVDVSELRQRLADLVKTGRTMQV